MAAASVREARFGAIKGNHVALIRTMHAEALTEMDDLKLNAVVYAVSMGSVEVLRELHQKGLDLSGYCDAEGFGTPAFYAVQFNKEQVLDLLMELGYDVVSQPCDKFCKLPLYHAVRLKREGIVQSLLHAKLSNHASCVLQRFMRRSVLKLKEAKVQWATRVIQQFWRERMEALQDYYARQQETSNQRAADEAERRKAMVVVDEFEEWDDDEDLYGV